MDIKNLFYYIEDQIYPQIILFNKSKLLHIKRIVKNIYKNKALTIVLMPQSIGFMFPKR